MLKPARLISKRQLFQSNPLVRDFKLLGCDNLPSLLRHENARFMPLYRDQILVEKRDGIVTPVTFPLQEMSALYQKQKSNPPRDSNESRDLLSEGQQRLEDDAILVGIHEPTKTPYFAVDVDQLQPWESDSRSFCNIRPFIMGFNPSTLPPHWIPLVAQAKMLTHWSRKSHFCGACGSKNHHVQIHNQAFHKQCSSCDNIIYPRLDPIVIALIVDTKNKRALLGRKHIFPKGVYSALAGFLEPGESIERGVQREIYEESHILVDVNKVEVVGSQTWPMSSISAELMIGCIAYVDDADSQEIIVDEEQEDVQWFALDDIRKAISGTAEAKSLHFSVPPSMAMAWNLMKTWVSDEDSILQSSL